MKRSAKLALSLLTRATDILRDGLCRLSGRALPPRCVVLYYHAVPNSLREAFMRQLDTIAKLAQPVSSNPPLPLAPGGRYVSLTFDDGFVSVVENAAPELVRRNIPWTMFVPSGCLGRTPDWLKTPHAAARRDRVMTAEELRTLSHASLVTIGSHTIAHANLLKVSPDRARTELAGSKADLEEVLGKPIDQFSYPFGARNSDLDRYAKDIGYTRVFSSDPAYAFTSRSPFVCGRVGVDPDIPSLELRLKLLGAYRWQSRSRNSHFVSPSPCLRPKLTE